MDPVTLATTATSLAAAFFSETIKGAVAETAKAAGAKLVGWIESKLIKPEERAAVEQFRQSPEDSDLKEMLGLHLRRRLREEPRLQSELEALIGESQRAGIVVQSLNITGDNNIGIQTAGSGNEIKIKHQ
jgi:hypothetical protein